MPFWQRCRRAAAPTAEWNTRKRFWASPGDRGESDTDCDLPPSFGEVFLRVAGRMPAMAQNRAHFIAKFLLVLGIGLYLVSLILPAVRVQIPFGGPENQVGLVALAGSPIYAVVSLVGIAYGFLLAAFFGWVALLANVLVVLSLHLYSRLLGGRHLHWLPAIVAIGALVWFCPRDGENSKFPELLLGYSIWAAAVSVTSAALLFAAFAYRLQKSEALAHREH